MNNIQEKGRKKRREGKKRGDKKKEMKLAKSN